MAFSGLLEIDLGSVLGHLRMHLLGDAEHATGCSSGEHEIATRYLIHCFLLRPTAARYPIELLQFNLKSAFQTSIGSVSEMIIALHNALASADSTCQGRA